MAISLQKGQKISLTKDAPNLNKVVVGLGWDENKKHFGASIDCDAFALVLENGKLMSPNDIVYYGHLKHPSGAIVHNGDNLTGAGAGDDEQIIIDLNNVPDNYNKIILAVNIYRCVPKKQHFGMIKNAFIRLFDRNTNNELVRYNLTDDYSGKTAVIFGELYRHGSEWKFSAVDNGTTDTSIEQFSQRYR